MELPDKIYPTILCTTKRPMIRTQRYSLCAYAYPRLIRFFVVLDLHSVFLFQRQCFVSLALSSVLRLDVVLTSSCRLDVVLSFCASYRFSLSFCRALRCVPSHNLGQVIDLNTFTVYCGYA